jgi:predicted GIY-YIG superfamily endonuclease
VQVTQGLLRDRLALRLAQMGDAPDYVKLAEEILTIRNAPEPLARRLVAQAMVVEDRRETWTRVGEKAVQSASRGPAVYLFRDANGRLLYVGKALNLQRRLRAHFAPGRWRALKPLMARVTTVEWQDVGSELEALLVESQLIQQLTPVANIQRERGDSLPTRSADVVVLLPSRDAASVMVIAARRDGAVLSQSTCRDASGLDDLAHSLADFFAARSGHPSEKKERSAADLASIVYAWLRQRGAQATRFDAADIVEVDEWRRRFSQALASTELFQERLVFR